MPDKKVTRKDVQKSTYKPKPNPNKKPPKPPKGGSGEK